MKKSVIKQPKTIRQKVYEHLKEAILMGDYTAGDRLVEAEIGKQIGTSRTPVREALHTLERERLISSIPRVGYIVSEINEKELVELCEIRLILESLALRWAFERSPRELTAAIKENIWRTEHLVNNRDIKSFVETDSAFHDIITKYADSGHLAELTQSVRSYMMRYRIKSVYTDENVTRAIDGHKKVLKALETGDLDTATIALCDHINQAKMNGASAR